MSYTTPVEVTNQRVTDLRKLWSRLLPLDVPNDSLFRSWLSSHSFLTVAYGLSEASQKFCRVQGNMPLDEVIRYSSKTMIYRTQSSKNSKTEREKPCRQPMN